jgi:AraC-like DNA-binding protein
MTDYLVRASALQGIRPAVEALGGDADGLLRRNGLAEAELDADSWISYRGFLLLLEEAATSTNCPHFGLHLSRHQDINILGTVGFIMQQAPDLRTALCELSLHFAHHNQGATLSLEIENGMAVWRFNCKLEGFAPVRQQNDLVAGIGVDIMRLLWNPAWSPNAVYLPHSPPQDTRPYNARFRCPISFNWDCMAMVFDAAILDKSIHEANPQLHRLLDDHLRTLKANFNDDYCGQVKHLIKQAMGSGDCSIERVAGFLAVNKRTLQRQLKEHGTSYRALLEEVRFNMARQYLRESNCSLTMLAEMLCYAELSVFSNAFRRQHGVSPREWKSQHGPH